jgi:GT2 family glycosyltransferase
MCSPRFGSCFSPGPVLPAEVSATEGAPDRPTGLRASITIPTYNRRAVLLQTLAGLERQSIQPERYEVIVAADGSNDGTVEALAGLRPAYALRWFYQENRGAVVAANAAGRLASHEVLIVLGDDQLASPELVAAHLEAHQRHGVVLVQGAYPLAPGYACGGASLVYERSRQGAMPKLVTDGSASWHVWGGNFSIRRQTWLEIGGWDEAFREYGGEDTDLGLRVAALGIPFIFEPRALTYHLHAVSPAQFGRQSFSTGRAVVRVARKHALALEEFSGSAIHGPLDRCLRWGWRSSPRAMEGLGRLLAIGLQTADLLRMRPAQVTAARLLRRFYRVGGITRELAQGLQPGKARRQASLS